MTSLYKQIYIIKNRAMSSSKTSVMKTAQIEKTKQTIQLLMEWHAKKEDFFKKYVPVQSSLIKRLLSSPEITINRLREIAQIAAEEKQILAFTFQKSEKFLINNQSKFLPPTEERIDPKDPKGQSKIKVQMPSWCNNVDRVLLSMSRIQKDKRSRIKNMYKTLDNIQGEMKREEEKYMGELKREEKELQKHFERLDKFEKEESKGLLRIIKESKGQNIKDSSFFISQIKNIQTSLHGQFEAFVQRNKIIAKMIQMILKNEKVVSKKIKEQLTVFLTYKKESQGKQSKAEEEIWGFLAIAEERVDEQRLKYFSAVLLRPERLESLKHIIKETQAKNNLQVISKFLQMSKTQMMDLIGVTQFMTKLYNNISYRCWPDVSLAQGWLIQSYTSAVIYMTYDYNMIIYSKEGTLLKKILTSSSNVDKVQGAILFLKEKIKGFFSDSVQEYKIKFQDLQRLEQFQLFIDNQIK